MLFGVAGIIWLLDRLTKLWVEDALAGRPPIERDPRGARASVHDQSRRGVQPRPERAVVLRRRVGRRYPSRSWSTAFRHTTRGHVDRAGVDLGGRARQPHRPDRAWARVLRRRGRLRGLPGAGRCSTSRTPRSWSAPWCSRSRRSRCRTDPRADARCRLKVRRRTGPAGRRARPPDRASPAPTSSARSPAGRVTVDGVVRSKSFALLGGESLAIEIDDVAPLQPEGPAVPVRFRGRHLLVVAKPAGMVTHPTARRRTGTLVNRLLGMGVPLPTAGGPARPGIVHRLDAGTSGAHAGGEDGRGARSAAGDVPSSRGRAPLPGARPRARRRTTRSRSTRRSDGAPRAWSSTATEGRPADDGVRGPRTAGLARPCSRRRPGPAAPIRSACTCRRSATRSSGTAPTAERGRRAPARAHRPFLHSWRIGVHAPDDGCAHRPSRSRSPRTSSAFGAPVDDGSAAGLATCSLDGPGRRAYLEAPAE